jgi:type IV pilus assembly protein PilB
MTTAHKKIGEILVDLKMINPVQLNSALSDQKAFGGRLGSHLVRMGFLSEDKLLDVLAHQLSLPKINLNRSTIRVDALAMVKEDICKKYCLVPVVKKMKTPMTSLLIAMNDPTDIEAIGTVEFAGNCRVAIALAPEREIRRVIQHCYTPAGLRECAGEKDLGGLSLELKEEGNDDFVLISSEDDHPSPLRSGADPGLRHLIELLIRKNIITFEEAEDLFRNM